LLVGGRERAGAGYVYEGIEGYVYTDPQRDHVPFYRLYQNGHHFFTADEGEKNDALESGWTFEGSPMHVLTFSVGGTQPLHRYHNVRLGDHLYTRSGS